MAASAFPPRSGVAIVLAALGGICLVAMTTPPAAAAENYVIPQSEGYGIGECMHAGSDCGRVVADSWCEAHGHAHVVAFGTVEDVTGTIQASAGTTTAQAASGDVLIRCGD